MKRKYCIIIPTLIFITWLLVPTRSYSQSYIDFSKYAGGSNADYATKMQVVNGETYLVGATQSANFPVTTGATYKGNTDITVTKYSSNGTVLYATILGSFGSDNFYSMKVINGEVYIVATADSSGYPVTNGSVFKGNLDIVITRLNTNGGIIFSTYIGGSNNDSPIIDADLQVAGNELFLAGTTQSPDFPVTSTLFQGVSDGFILKLNATDGSIILSNFYGGSGYDYSRYMLIENGSIYLIAVTTSIDLTVTVGSFPGNTNNTSQQHIFIKKINSSNFNTIYARYLGGNKEDYTGAANVVNGILHLTGSTTSTNFPVTNGTTGSGQPNPTDGFYTRLNTDGSIAFSTYLSTADIEFFSQMIISNGDVYVMGISINFSGPAGDQSLIIVKINANGTFGYTKQLPYDEDYSILPSFELVNGDIFIGGRCSAPDFPVTNNSQFYDIGTTFFTHLDPLGNIVYSTFLGKAYGIFQMKYANNKFYFLGQADVASYQVTDSSIIKGATDNIVVILKTDGTNVFTSYIGGSSDDTPAEIIIDNNDVYIDGKTGSNDYPVTNTTLLQGMEDQFVTKLSFCPTSFDLSGDTLSPKIQTVCKFGLAQIIKGEKIMVPSDSLPAIYLNGILTVQKPIEGTYQWQTATSPTGPWTDIPTATFKDYRPVTGSADQYFRRLTFTSPNCGSTFIHSSDTATVLVNSLTAPVVNAGGPFITCPGAAITIGGSPTVTGGNPPYSSYNWDMGAAPVPSPSVSPNANTIYTLIVTDNLGCQQIGQALVFVYRANAGLDKSDCAGVPVRIGTPQIPGVPGIVYAWLPTTALTNPSIAQPFANPLVTTDYELTLTVPKSGGGTCSTKDTVRVIAVAAPVTPDFAGPDKVICLGDNTSLGTPPEAGFNYVWSPGSYLNSNTGSTTTYYPGQFLMPIPNPTTIHLTAQKDGCSFHDDVVVATIESQPGFGGCGPLYLGQPDRTPNINETYLWTKVSGPGNFTGATNLPQVPVSASVGGNTVYGLLVSYNGGSCYKEVVVPDICPQGCAILIGIDAQYGCPGFDVNGGNVTLYAFSGIPNAIYTWEPHAGLDTYTGNVVHLTDNVPRTYTITATDINDTSHRCIGQISVNNPSFQIPVFPAPDVYACANTPITIGLPPVTGYTYQWTGPGLSDHFSSDPIATVPIQTVFPVLVTDIFGCLLHDTVTVFVQTVQADAGDDWVICNAATVQLGTPAQPNTTYLWEPQASPWQNGTNQFSAQPEVLVAIDVTITVTATTSAGCITTDNVNIIINSSPTIPSASDQVICVNGSVMIGSPALPGVIYHWTPATGLDNPNIAQPIASPAVTTTYSLLATFTGSCVTPATDEVIVTVSDPAFNIPDIHYCPGNGAVALGTNAPPNMAFYFWSPPQLVTNNNIANPSTLNPPPNTTTVFTLFVANNDGCSYEDSVTIIPSIAGPDAGIDKTICKNQTTTIGSAANLTGPGISYSWNPVSNLSNATIPNPLFTGTTSGTFTYTLTITDNAVSCSVRDTVTIKVIDPPILVLNSPTICQNSCVQIGTTPLPGIQYQWTPAAGLSNPTIANPLACVAAVTANYTLTATDQNGCSSSANVVVGVNALPAAQINIPTVTACVGDNNTTFNPIINPPGSYSYLWSPDNGTLSNVNIPNPTIVIGGVGNAQYVLQVTDDITGCTNTAIANLVVTSCSTLATVSDFMWFDTNTNGLQDPGELGVSGMPVKLYNNLGIIVATAITDANGLYSFVNISPGNDYYVIFNKPAGYDFTLQNVGGIAAANNSKVDQNGRSNNFNIPTGANINNIDAGIKPTGGVPVTLLSFTATLLTREVLLNWQTTAEYNNHYFDVERSIDGNNFIAIGSVNGNGTTSLPHNYSLIDPNPIVGINYYRLKQVDLDRNGTYSHIVPIRLRNDEVVSVFYNNLSNTIQVILNNAQDNLQLKLYANNGQLIKAVTAANNITSYTFELPVLSKGIYLLQLINNKFTYSKKLFIDRK